MLHPCTIPFLSSTWRERLEVDESHPGDDGSRRAPFPDRGTARYTEMSTHRPPIANVSRVLYVAMALSALVSIAVYAAIATLLIDLVRSTPIESASDALWLAAIILSVPATVAAILLAVLRTHVPLTVGGLTTAFVMLAWNLSFGDRTIAMLLLVPTALILLVAAGLALRPSPAGDTRLLTRPE